VELMKTQRIATSSRSKEPYQVWVRGPTGTKLCLAHTVPELDEAVARRFQMLEFHLVYGWRKIPELRDSVTVGIVSGLHGGDSKMQKCAIEGSMCIKEEPMRPDQTVGEWKEQISLKTGCQWR
jgi:hypothetical protein